jgi:hypothetical protein
MSLVVTNSVAAASAVAECHCALCAVHPSLPNYTLQLSTCRFMPCTPP